MHNGNFPINVHGMMKYYKAPNAVLERLCRWVKFHFLLDIITMK